MYIYREIKNELNKFAVKYNKKYRIWEVYFKNIDLWYATHTHIYIYYFYIYKIIYISHIRDSYFKSTLFMCTIFFITFYCKFLFNAFYAIIISIYILYGVEPILLLSKFK